MVGNGRLWVGKVEGLRVINGGGLSVGKGRRVRVGTGGD